MPWWKKCLLGSGISLVLLVAAAYAAFVYHNQPVELQEPNYFSYYKNQDSRPEGKVGVYISQMILPETFDQEVYYNVFFKPLTIIPWPIRELLKMDNGLPLYDPERYFEFEAFTPTRLVDYRGRDTDIDGVPYVEKFQQGLIDFEPGQGGYPGYFVYGEREAGMPTKAAELITKARVYYHAEGAGLVSGLVPEEYNITNLVAETMALVRAKYGPEVEWRWANTERYSEARQAMFELLDSGVDTIVFAPPRPIMSHFEEFNGSVRDGMEYIAEWEQANGKSIKAIIAPQLADFPQLRTAYLNLLRAQLDTIPRDKAVKVVASFHGMPWEMVANEAWLELSPAYLQTMMSDIQRMLSEEYGYQRHQAVLAQDYFAEMTDKYPGTNSEMWQGVNEGFDYVINLPLEFITENTDTLFAHAVVNFKGFDDYDVYEPIDYPDWDKPLIRTVREGSTTIIYAGVPVGEFNDPLVAAHFASIDSVLSRSLPVLSSWQAPAMLSPEQSYAVLAEEQ